LVEPQDAIVTSLRESWFWSGIFRDHASFLRNHTAPGQEKPIEWAESFRRSFQTLHAETEELARNVGIAGPAGSYALTAAPAEAPLTGLQGQELSHYSACAARVNRSLAELTASLRAFKEQVLQQKLDCKIDLSLPPVLIAHMITEADEAYRVLVDRPVSDPSHPVVTLLHHHLIWLPDAAGHAALLHGSLDGVEQSLLQSTADFKRIFDGMQIKAMELYSMLRVAPRMIGALRRLTRDSLEQIGVFRAFLSELREHLEGCEVLGSIAPVLVDHMLREELYYTEKMMMSSDR